MSTADTQTRPWLWYALTRETRSRVESSTCPVSMKTQRREGVWPNKAGLAPPQCVGIQSPWNNNRTLSHYQTYEHEVARSWAYLPDAKRERLSSVSGEEQNPGSILLWPQVSNQVSLPLTTDSLWGTCLWVNHNTHTHAHTPPAPTVKCGTRVLWQNQRSPSLKEPTCDSWTEAMPHSDTMFNE